MKSVLISFDEEWVLSRRSDDEIPSELLAKEIERRYDVSEIETSVSSLSFNIYQIDDVSKIQSGISEILIMKFGSDDYNEIVTIKIEEYNKTVECTEDDSSPIQNSSSEIIERITSLIAASEYKDVAKECVNISKGFKAHKITDVFSRRSYIISINDGYGLTTYLNLFCDLIRELGLFKPLDKNSVSEITLRSIETDADDVFNEVWNVLRRHSSGNILCIDISEWMTKVYSKQFRHFLKKLYVYSENNVIFFRVPFVESTVLYDISMGINDVFFVKPFSVVPFSNSELMEYARKIIAEKGFSVSNDSLDIINKRINEEKSDGRFYGLKTINKIVYEVLYLKELSDSNKEEFDDHIEKNDISLLISKDTNVPKSGTEQLSGLIGVDQIRDKLQEIVAQITASVSMGLSSGSPCIHMRFVGNPGTGKTTIARVLGRILKEKGILRNGDFFEYSGRELCGRYVGETAPKTSAICRDAYGSVLFIDEAYTLFREHFGGSADYGREAIDTLISEMENHRNDFVVIMAGYPDEMEELMKSNSGLLSRMPYQIDFPNYSRDVLSKMFMSMIDKNFRYDENLETVVSDYFDNMSDEIIGSKEFSNARYVRNLYERTWGKAVLRCQLNNADNVVITKSDFQCASSETEFKGTIKKKKSIGF